MKRLSVLITGAVVAALLTGAVGARPALAAGSTATTTGAAPVPDTTYGRNITFQGGIGDTDLGCTTFLDDAHCDTPTGDVELYDNGAANPFRSQSLNAPHYPCDCDAPYLIIDNTLPVGHHTVLVQYSGDGEFAPSSKSVSFNIAKQNSSVALSTAAANPSVTGQSFSLDATVSAANGPLSGTVSFMQGGTTLATVPLGVDHTAHALVAPSKGTYTFSALYSGDTNHLQSLSGGLDRTVVASNTTTTLASSANPSVFGQPVTFASQTTPTSPGGGVSNGSVTFSLDGQALPAGPVSTTNGAATSGAVTPSVGTHSVGAAYTDPAANYNASAAQLSQVVNKADTKTTLSTSQNPSALGQPVTFTATVGVVSPGAGTPTGSVQFRNGGAVIATAVLAGNFASVTVSTLTGGNASITVTYPGDGNFNGSTSAPFIQTVRCDTVYSGSTSGELHVPAGGTACLNGASVSGDLVIPAGARVSMVNSTVSGSLTSNGPSSLIVCGSTVKGPVSVANSTGVVLVGDPYDDACAGNTFNGSVSFASSRQGLEFVGNNVSGAVRVRGTVSGVTEVGSNDIIGDLSCTGDNPVATDGNHPNTVRGTRSGECSSPTF